ncbi:MAG: hypothetical protein RSB39_05940 [Oscillospiraceae bacterium]
MIRRFSARVDVIRNGAKFTELKFVDAPAINADSKAKIKTSLSGSFVHNPLVDYFKDELQPVVDLDGIEHKLGIYRVGTISTRYTGAYTHYDAIEAYDRGFLLTQHKTENTLHLAAGANYIATIEQLLTTAGISQKITTPNTATLQTAREDWDVGTEYIDIINQLLSEINYRNIWFNADGYAILEPCKEPSAESINHTYDATTEMSVTMADCATETDIFDKPNVFVAIVSNPDLAAPMTATSENDNPNSALSITSRGMRIPTVCRVDNIANQAELQKYVDNLRNRSLLSTETVTIKTAVMPGHGIGDTLAINHPPIQGIFEETSWWLKMNAGQQMTHKAKRVIIV